jgi:chromosome segregation ATPase
MCELRVSSYTGLSIEDDSSIESFKPYSGIYFAIQLIKGLGLVLTPVFSTPEKMANLTKYVVLGLTKSIIYSAVKILSIFIPHIESSIASRSCGQTLNQEQSLQRDVNSVERQYEQTCADRQHQEVQLVELRQTEQNCREQRIRTETEIQRQESINQSLSREHRSLSEAIVAQTNFIQTIKANLEEKKNNLFQLKESLAASQDENDLLSDFIEKIDEIISDPIHPNFENSKTRYIKLYHSLRTSFLETHRDNLEAISISPEIAVLARDLFNYLDRNIVCMEALSEASQRLGEQSNREPI